MLALIAISLFIQTPPAPPTPARPADNRYVGGASFADNRYRQMVIESAYAIRQREREAARQNLRRDRLILADRLDAMIGSGECDAARRVAESSGWSDIAGEVTRVCAARAEGQD